MIDQLVAEIARLKARVETLENAAFATGDEYVEGWTRAAEIVGVSALTCKRRSLAGNFPAPCRRVEIPRTDGDAHEKLSWRRADLVAYAEGK